MSCLSKKIIFFLVVLLHLCHSIDQMCYVPQKNETCPINSFCNKNQYCQCQEGWALWCDLPSITLTEQDKKFNISEKPLYFTIVPSDIDSIFIYRFFLCGMSENNPIQVTLRLYADEGTQRQLNNQNLIGNITLTIKNQCWPLSSPYMNFNLQPNGKIQQMILSINIEGSKQPDGSRTATIGLNVYQIFLIKLSTLWIIVIIFISFVALSLILGLGFCIYQLRNSKRGRFIDNNINYFDQIIPKYKITSSNYLADNMCPVCLLDLQIGSEVRKTLCNHVFHHDCLDNWCKKNLSCPVCRSDMSKNYLKQRARIISQQGAINNSGVQELEDCLQLNDRQDSIKQKLITQSPISNQ